MLTNPQRPHMLARPPGSEADPAIARLLAATPPVVQPASPHGIQFPEGHERWWRPTWSQRLRHVRWPWLIVPAAMGLVIYVGMRQFPEAMEFLLRLQPGFVVVLFLMPVFLAFSGAFGAIKRTDPFCIHCGYSLSGLPDHHTCPECGMPYSHATIDEYKRSPQWFIRRWRQRHSHCPTHAPLDAGPGPRRKPRDGT